MSFIDSFMQMAVLFLLVIVGFLCNRCKLMDEQFDRRLAALIINLTAPFIILASVMGDTLPKREDILPVLIAGTLALLFMVIVSFPVTKLLRLSPEESGVYKFMYVFGNINFIGFPVVGSLFGTEAIFYASVLTIPFNILVFALGVLFITQGKSTTRFNWRILFSPCLSATYLSIIIVFFQIKVPHPIAQCSSLIGSITIPGSLLIIGSTLAGIPVKSMFGSPKIYMMCLIKLLIVPAIIYAIFLISPIDRKYADVLVVLCAMPVASYGTMLCLKHGIETKTMAQGTFMTTLLSVFTIPLLAVML